MAPSAHGRQKEEKVDGVADRRRRELQVVRAEGEACRRTAEQLDWEMADARATLDAAVDAYARRRAELSARETDAHDRLARVLDSRSAAEHSLELVRDRAENELKARRTAATVRAYRLDERWRQLHGRYRGFALDVLVDGDGGRARDRDARQHAKSGGRRFFVAADRVSAQHRRESLRTARSLHSLMAGYLRETTTTTTTMTTPAAAGAVRGRGRRRSLAALDGTPPARVLDKLRVMQEQCARIAERVRRRSGFPAAAAAASDGPGSAASRDDGSGGGGGGGGDGDDDDKRRQADLLSEAQRRLAAGTEYVRRTRELMDRAVADVRREHATLRELLCDACAVCVGRKAARQDGSCAVVELAGRLERACFALFVRLDGVMSADAAAATRRPAAARRVHDVVASCLHAVQAHRAETVRRDRDVAHRVHNFHKTVDRLLLATSRQTTAAAARRAPRSVATPRPPPPADSTARARGKTPRKIPTLEPSSAAAATAAVATDTATVTMLCPPSIGIIEYE